MSVSREMQRKLLRRNNDVAYTAKKHHVYWCAVRALRATLDLWPPEPDKPALLALEKSTSFSLLGQIFGGKRFKHKRVASLRAKGREIKFYHCRW